MLSTPCLKTVVACLRLVTALIHKPHYISVSAGDNGKKAGSTIEAFVHCVLCAVSKAALHSSSHHLPTLTEKEKAFCVDQIDKTRLFCLSVNLQVFESGHVMIYSL